MIAWVAFFALERLGESGLAPDWDFASKCRSEVHVAARLGDSAISNACLTQALSCPMPGRTHTRTDQVCFILCAPIHKLQDNPTPFWTGIVAHNDWLHATAVVVTYICNQLFFSVKAGPPLEAILVIFGRRALIFFFCLKALGKKWKMTPLLCACAVVITLETQKCRKRAPRSVEFNFFINCDRHKRFSQNERRRADLQNVASDFLIFA